jgi:predicted secreted hydrolase
MSSKLLLLLMTAALPGYHFQFPRDHFNHPDFETEWWYYTGNLTSS